MRPLLCAAPFPPSRNCFQPCPAQSLKLRGYNDEPGSKALLLSLKQCCAAGMVPPGDCFRVELFQPSLVIGPTGLQVSYTALDTAGQGSGLELVLGLVSNASAQHAEACFRLAGVALFVPVCCRTIRASGSVPSTAGGSVSGYAGASADCPFLYCEALQSSPTWALAAGCGRGSCFLATCLAGLDTSLAAGVMLHALQHECGSPATLHAGAGCRMHTRQTCLQSSTTGQLPPRGPHRLQHSSLCDLKVRKKL